MRRRVASSSHHVATHCAITVSCDGSQYETATVGFVARCFVFNVWRPVAIQPVAPSQIGWRIRENGRPLVSTVVTVHQTMRRTRSSKVLAISWNDAVSGMTVLRRPRVRRCSSARKRAPRPADERAVLRPLLVALLLPVLCATAARAEDEPPTIGGR